jgi:2-succinyl-6-hydroxy-2,4-cyclohexadiene-1-carboxylate synthase
MTHQRSDITIRGLPYHVTVVGEGPAVLWLHGFTGSHATFLPFAQKLPGFTHVLPDLPGHGGTVHCLSPARIRSTQLASDLDALMNQLGHAQYDVVGYSMGGRLALALAARHPQHVRQLVLESASPGLDGAYARAERRLIDTERADMIRAQGLAAFLEAWEQLPLFASQSVATPSAVALQRQIRQQQSEVGLRMSLLGHGTGVQPSYWPDLIRFGMPVYLMTGALDIKFTKTAQRMMRYLVNGRHTVVPHAGHTIHIEKEQVFVDFIRRVLQAPCAQGSKSN